MTYRFTSFLLRHIGNWMFTLNGGLNGLDRHNRRNRLMFWCWSRSYRCIDILTGEGLK